MPQLINLNVFKNFLRSSNAGGTLLFFAVIISMIVANSSFAQPLQQLLDRQLGFENESIHLKYSILLWIND